MKQLSLVTKKDINPKYSKESNHKLNGYLSTLITCLETLKLSSGLSDEDISMMKEMEGIIWNIKDLFYEITLNHNKIAGDDSPLYEQGGITVLFIDGDFSSLKRGKTILKKLGYKSVCVNELEKALEIYRQDFHNIDLILLDLDTPGLSLSDTLEKIFKINSSSNVLVSKKGHLPKEMMTIFKEGVKGFISKPFNGLDISMNIKALFDDQNIALNNQSFEFNPSMLIVDDDKYMSNFLKNIFLREGWEVDIAEDGEEGIELIKKKSYSFVKELSF